ncbi:helix-turn-helix transcriptional regulator [Azospirillum halopraeferens]|uniref:helix-turn-helix transcriptional regulator n=1 Tax=Azospirillum halopraeferens TaxID=34010 RepID=UPI00040261B9|nr:helix-turn-helix domain-containing protein [Azospirillum halopraeferens]
MNGDARLYERAADGSAPLWHLDRGFTFFAGPLDYNASHQHGAPVYLAGLHGPFGLRLPGTEWMSCRTAVIPAGALHELDVGGNPIAVLYIEPHVAGVHALLPLVRDGREVGVGGALVGGRGEVSLVRDLYEDPAGGTRAGAALRDLVGFSDRRAARSIDGRVARVVGAMHANSEDLTPVNDLAAGVGMSASRFQHVFTREVGVPFRRYRAWCRMRAAIGAIVEGNTFTAAAHAAGYADQPHFAHDFRRTFGAPASRSLTGVRPPPGRRPAQHYSL